MQKSVKNYDNVFRNRTRINITLHLPGFRPLRICADLQDFSAGFCKERCTESWRSIQICKIFTEVCRFSLKIFAEFLTTSWTTLADQGSVSWYSRSLKILEKKNLPPSRLWLLDNEPYWLYTVIYPFHLNFPDVVVELWEARLPHWLRFDWWNLTCGNLLGW